MQRTKVNIWKIPNISIAYKKQFKLNIEQASHVEQRTMFLILLTVSYIFQAEATGKICSSCINGAKTKYIIIIEYLLSDKQYFVKKTLKIHDVIQVT